VCLREGERSKLMKPKGEERKMERLSYPLRKFMGGRLLGTTRIFGGEKSPVSGGKEKGRGRKKDGQILS